MVEYIEKDRKSLNVFITFSACVFRIQRIQMLIIDPRKFGNTEFSSRNPSRNLGNPGFLPENSRIQDSCQKTPDFPRIQAVGASHTGLIFITQLLNLNFGPSNPFWHCAAGKMF